MPGPRGRSAAGVRGGGAMGQQQSSEGGEGREKKVRQDARARPDLVGGADDRGCQARSRVLSDSTQYINLRVGAAVAKLDQ